MENRSLSIIVPVKNSARTLPFLFEALSRQTVRPQKIILVDNDSNDTSLKIMEDFKNSYKGEVSILSERKRGPSACRNKGIAHADTELVGFFDSDVIPPDDWVINAVSFLENHPGIDFVYGYIEGYPPTGLFFRFQSFYRHEAFEGFAETEEDIFRERFIMFSNAICRRNFLNRVGKLREDYFPAEDTEFNIRAVRQGAKLYINYRGILARHYEKYTFTTFIKSRCLYRLYLAKIIREYFKGKLIIRNKDSVVIKDIGFATVWIGNLLWLIAGLPFLFAAFFYPILFAAAPFLLCIMNFVHVFYKGLKKKGYTFKELIIFGLIQTAVVAGLLFTQAYIFLRYFLIMV